MLEDKQDFVNDYADFFNGIAIAPPKGACSGNLKITKMFLYCSVTEPARFLDNLATMGIDCDCRFIQALDNLMILKSPYSIKDVTKGNDGYYVVDWDLSDFKLAIEAMHTKEMVGVKIIGGGYFPPKGIQEMVINMVHDHKTLLVIDKNSFGQIRDVKKDTL